MNKERFKYYYNERVKRYEVFDCYVNLPLSKNGVIKILNDQQDKISDLEAKLAESEKERDSNYENYSICWKENTELKQQLEDAEEHIDNLELQLREQYQLVDEKDEQLAEKEQDKISFAVEQLVNVKNRIQEDFDYDDLMCWLDKQIKQLKEMK